jgi:Fe2+ or Zn2+ uptake regulation protein
METTNLVVDQVVECNDTPDQRRQVYHQHHVICFHCTKEMELKAAVVKKSQKMKRSGQLR